MTDVREIDAAKPARSSEEGMKRRDDTVRWPLWWTALGVMVFCTLAWSGIIYLLIR